MAEKGFGVKEVNLIGASGTPTITSPNNINMNAVNVAISTNVSIGGTLSVTGNVSVGGTLTYEDVTNIDSVGLITARSGINVSGGNINVVNGYVGKDSSGNRLLFHANNETRIFHSSNAQVKLTFYGTGEALRGSIDANASQIQIKDSGGRSGVVVVHGAESRLYFNDNQKIATSNTGATVTGTLVATTFSGSGASLTNLPAANLTGTLPAISGANLTNLPSDTPTNSDIQVAYTVTANGSSAYRFEGNGVVSSADNPDIYLIRGQKYRFINNSGGSHPFQIREASGGTAYSTGVTNNGASSGNIDFAPTYNSPAQLVYQCTNHGGMVGTIYLRDAAGNNTNVGVTTFTGDLTIPDKIIHSGDTNTAIRFPAADTITAETGGTERLRITSDGKIGINNNNPIHAVHIKSVMASSPSFIHMTSTGSNVNGGGGGIAFDTSAANTDETKFIATIAGIRNGEGNGSNDLVFSTTKLNVNGGAPTEKVRITSDGAIGLGGANYGSSGQVLTSQGSGSAVVWASASGGKLVNYAQTFKTDTFSQDVSANADSNDVISISYAAASSSNKLLIMASLSTSSEEIGFIYSTLYIGGSINSASIGDSSGSRSRVTMSGRNDDGGGVFTHTHNYLHSSPSTSSTTYSYRLSHGAPVPKYIVLNQTYSGADNYRIAHPTSSITILEFEP